MEKKTLLIDSIEKQGTIRMDYRAFENSKKEKETYNFAHPIILSDEKGLRQQCRRMLDLWKN